MRSIWNLIRGLLYPLSRIPGLGFLYEIDRMVSRGEGVRSSFKSFQAQRDVEKENKARGDHLSNSGDYDSMANGMVEPMRNMAQSARNMDPNAAEVNQIDAIIREVEDIVNEYRGDSEGFSAAMGERNYFQEIANLQNAISARKAQN